MTPDQWMLGTFNVKDQSFFVLDWNGKWTSTDTVIYESSFSKRKMILKAVKVLEFWSDAERALWEIVVFPFCCWEEIKKRHGKKETPAPEKEVSTPQDL